MAVNSYAPAAGYKGQVQIAAVGLCSVSISVICANAWSFNETIDNVDVGSICSNGYREYLPGMKKSVFTFSGVWDFNYNPFSAVPKLKIGEQVCVTLFIDQAGHAAIFARAPTALVIDWEITERAEGLCEYTCTMVGNWTFNDFANTNA